MEPIPHEGTGILDSLRIPHDTSFAVRIADADGMDITQWDSIVFTIDDGVAPYTRDLSNTDVVGVTKLTDDEDTGVTDLWAVYHRSGESVLGNYSFGYYRRFRNRPKPPVEKPAMGC